MMKKARLHANHGQPNQGISTPGTHSDAKSSTKMLEHAKLENRKKNISVNKSSKYNPSSRKKANVWLRQKKKKERFCGSEYLRLRNQKKVKMKLKVKQVSFPSNVRKRRSRSSDELYRKVSIGEGWPRRGVIGYLQRHSDADSAYHPT